MVKTVEPEVASHEAYRFPQQHEFPNTLMQDRQFRHFIIITIIVPLEHDSVFRRENASGQLRPLEHTPVSLHSSATKRPSMPYAAHLDIRRQIGDIGARLELVESWAVAHTPEIVIARILDLHAQRCRCTPQFESVTATHEKHRLCRKLRHIINAGRGSTKV